MIDGNTKSDAATSGLDGSTEERLTDSWAGRAKRLARRLAPGAFFTLKRIRNARHFRRGHGGAEYRAKSALVRRYGLRVIAGPFAGMPYGHDVNCGAYVAKLVGSYEEELHPIVERIGRTTYDRVIDVGCAEGYYAVGFARLLPDTVVYAYDTDEDSRRYCADLSRRAGVDSRVVIGGFCDAAELNRRAGPGALVMCDCEGYEAELLDPDRAPALADSDLLVEVHETLRPGVTSLLLERFGRTHDVELIDTVDREPARYPQLDVVEPADRPWAVREGRGGPMQWAWMQSRSSRAKVRGKS